MATWQQVCDTAGRRLGDESTTFVSTVLFSYVTWVMRDLAQAGCLDNTLRKSTTFNFTASTRDYTVTTITGETQAPLTIRRLFVPTWGYPTGVLQKIDDDAFNYQMAMDGPTITGRPRFWRLYPNIFTLQVHPIPNSDNSGASYPCTIEYIDHPTVSLIGDTITEITDDDLPAVVAGVYYYGALFTDETHGDVGRALQEYEAWKARLISRHNKDRVDGRPVFIKPRRF